MGAPFLDVDTSTVETAGRDTAGTAGSWAEWGSQVGTGFGDALDVVGNATLIGAASGYGERWNPVAQRVAGRVANLGRNTHNAAVAVEAADADGAVLLVGQTQRADQQASLLTRPISYA